MYQYNRGLGFKMRRCCRRHSKRFERMLNSRSARRLAAVVRYTDRIGDDESCGRIDPS